MSDLIFTSVIPAKAGIQITPAELKPLDPGFKPG
jgi:hypothetical protein